MGSPLSSKRAYGRVSLALVVALGVGATLAVTSVLQKVFFDAGPFAKVDRLVVIENVGVYQLSDLDGDVVRAPTVSWPDYRDLQAQQRSFAGIGGLTRPTKAIWDAQDRRRSVLRVHVEGDLFRLTGIRPVLGRLIDATDFRDGAAPVAVITEQV